MLKTVKFVEKEKMKEGFKNGKMWVKYQYLGDDGEHYTLFGDHDLEVPYQLAQKEREFQGKKYTDWFIVQDKKGGGTGVKSEVAKQPGPGVVSILEKLEELIYMMSECKRILDMVEKSEQKKIDASLPF